MTDGNQKPDGNSGEQVTVTDKRRIDPETGEVRHVPPGDMPGGTAAADAAHTEDKVAELTADLQRVQADFANYRKRALRDQQRPLTEPRPALSANCWVYWTISSGRASTAIWSRVH
ncbi:molecular chaperone Hsp70 [Mycobacterium tuberculosis]|nr:molecular chaperone Hsp70 [Mycobacterium tuberculosis]